MYVYFIRAGKKGAIKIGVASNIERRIATLQTGNPSELQLIAAIPCTSRNDAFFLEECIHKMFEKQRIRGEWFDGDIRINQIKEIKDPRGAGRKACEVEGGIGETDSVNAALDAEFSSIMG